MEGDIQSYNDAGGSFAPSPKQTLLTTEQAAEILGVTKRCLECWRLKGRGPKFVTLGSKWVRYDPADIKSFIDKCKKQCTTENNN